MCIGVHVSNAVSVCHLEGVQRGAFTLTPTLEILCHPSSQKFVPPPTPQKFCVSPPPPPPKINSPWSAFASLRNFLKQNTVQPHMYVFVCVCVCVCVCLYACVYVHKPLCTSCMCNPILTLFSWTLNQSTSGSDNLSDSPTHHAAGTTR